MAVALLRKWSSEGGGRSGQRLYLWCPGCDDFHAVEVDPANSPCWTWDGNFDVPTVNPSILTQGVQWDQSSGFYKPNHADVAAGERIACHSFVRSGQWEFLGDSTHHLKGQTVPLPALPDWFVEEGGSIGRDTDVTE